MMANNLYAALLYTLRIMEDKKGKTFSNKICLYKDVPNNPIILWNPANIM